MTVLSYLPAVLSSLFRLFAYIFLQIIPTRLAPPVLPALYLLYIFTTWSCPPPKVHKHEKSNPSAKTHPSSPLSVLVFSLPTHSRPLKWANILTNTLLILAAADLAVTPFFDTANDVAFTRVGAVYPDSVKIQVRYPHSTDHTLLVLYRETQGSASDASPAWKDGPQAHPNQASDWVDTVRLSNLWPSTAYEYTLATLNKTILPIASAPIPFRTFPDPRLHTGSRFRFIATSCITPNFPYRGPFNKRTIRGFDLLADYLKPTHDQAQNDTLSANNTATQNLTAHDTILTTPERPPTDFLLFLGDFIYADVPLYIGDDQEAYRRLYRRNYASPSYRKVYEQLPVIHAYDDHEFVNNYVGNSEEAPPYANASGAYNIYAGKPNYDPAQPGQSFYDFRHGDVAFFVMDTRRYRTPATGPDRTMLGDAQLTALYNWLHAVNETASFKFIVSSVPFTSLWTLDAQIDSWAGYPAEKAALLDVFHSVPNLIIISGDRHEFAAIEFSTSDPKLHVVREISTSPLNMFYIPFIHTLRPQSEEKFARNLTSAGNDTEQVPYERVIAYLPEGNSKWSTFEIDTTDRKKPTLRLETIIDGKPAYHLEIVGVPTRHPNFINLGTLVVTNVKDIFDKIGLKPGRWF